MFRITRPLKHHQQKNSEEKGQEKTIMNVKTVLTEKEGQPTPITEKQTHPTVHDSSSNTSPSQVEILSQKRKNLIEAL